jgi:uncharacterized protein (DUF58 family)
MTARATPHLVLVLAVALVAAAASLVLDDPAPVAVAAPFALAGLAAVAAPAPRIDAVHLRAERDRMIVGQHLELSVRVDGRGLHWVELQLDLSDHVSADGPRRLLVPVGADTTFAVRADRWGGGALIGVEVCGRGLLGLRTVRTRGKLGHGLRIYPADHQLRRLLAPRQLAAVGGSHVSRDRGEGFDYAESRPYVRGDRLRDVNWRMTGRRGEMWVDQRHPERSGSVVLFLDSFAGTGTARDTTLGSAIEAGVSLARTHLRWNDRLGLLDLGGTLRWIPARAGNRQRFQIVEALVESEVIETWADKDLDVVPTAALPPGALVVALTSLEDPRILRTLLQLRARQYEVAVMECAPAAAPADDPDPVVQLAERLAALEREVTRGSLRRAGAPVATWPPGTPLDPLLRQLAIARRQPRGVGAGA